MLSKESIRKLKAVKAAILAQPELYDQSVFPSARERHTCNTPCCFAGWAVWLNNPDPKAYEATIKEKDHICAKELADALGITGVQAEDLYENWTPETGNAIGDAAEGARRIDIFIKSGGSK